MSPKLLLTKISVQFRHRFRDYKGQSAKGLPFSADFFYDTLEEFNPQAINFQEDAQEYLAFLLNKAHEELLKELEPPKKPKGDTTRRKRAALDDDDGWQQVVAGSAKSATVVNV